MNYKKLIVLMLSTSFSFVCFGMGDDAVIKKTTKECAQKAFLETMFCSLKVISKLWTDVHNPHREKIVENHLNAIKAILAKQYSTDYFKKEEIFCRDPNQNTEYDKLNLPYLAIKYYDLELLKNVAFYIPEIYHRDTPLNISLLEECQKQIERNTDWLLQSPANQKPEDFDYNSQSVIKVSAIIEYLSGK